MNNRNVISTNLDVNDIQLNFRPTKAKSISRVSGASSKLNIVFTEKFGKRLVISEDVINELGNASKVQVSFVDNGIAIGPKIPGSVDYHNLKKSGSKGVIYTADLVKEIVDEFKLNFDDKTSLSFYKVDYVSRENCPIAIFEILNSNSPDNMGDESNDDNASSETSEKDQSP